MRAPAVGQLPAAISAGTTSALVVASSANGYTAGNEGYGILVRAIGAAAGPLVLMRFVRNPRHPAAAFWEFVLHGVVDLPLATLRQRTEDRGTGAAVVTIPFMACEPLPAS